MEEGLWRGGSHGNQNLPIQLSLRECPPPCANRLPSNEGSPTIISRNMSQHLLTTPPPHFHPRRRGSQKLHPPIPT